MSSIIGNAQISNELMVTVVLYSKKKNVKIYEVQDSNGNSVKKL